MPVPPHLPDGCVDLDWLPLGAGGRCIRMNGRIFEAAVALREHRSARDHYHSALEVSLGDRRRVLALTPRFRTATWALDEQRTGDMWNSTSLTSWLLASSGHDLTTVAPPAGGRAPGWRAGLVAASR